MKIKDIVKQSIDLHVHVGPEIIPRKFTVDELAKIEKGKIAGIAVKSHFNIISRIKSELKIIYSVTLNNCVGGLNSDIVYSIGKGIIWFPTISADNYLRKSKYEIRHEWVNDPNFKPKLSKDVKVVKVTENGKLTDKAISVLNAIKDIGSVLATGHISWQESKLLVEEAIRLGIKKIIVTHPIYPLIDMPLDVQKEIADKGAFIEQCYSMWKIDNIPIEKIVKQIKFIGADRCIISSDVGQVFSKNPSESLEEFIEVLMGKGVTEKEIIMMCIENPIKLIFQKN
jgi:hypothetical protein